MDLLLNGLTFSLVKKIVVSFHQRYGIFQTVDRRGDRETVIRVQLKVTFALNCKAQ
jgi:hypothetical protein